MSVLLLGDQQRPTKDLVTGNKYKSNHLLSSFAALKKKSKCLRTLQEKALLVSEKTICLALLWYYISKPSARFFFFSSP